MDSRLEKINAVAIAHRNEELARQNAYENKISNLCRKIDNLRPRVQYLCKVAQALSSNGMFIGKPIKGIVGCRGEFVTDGIDHAIGFYLKGGELFTGLGGKVVGFGIEGGGCCGGNLKLDINGNMVEGLRTLKRFGTEPEEGKMVTLLNAFDEFEKKFLEFVDNLK